MPRVVPLCSLAFAAAALMALACGDPGGETPLGGPYGVSGTFRPGPDGPGEPDSGDGPGDAGDPPPFDAGGSDAAEDTGEPPPVDGGADSSEPVDSGHDAGHDAGPPPPPTWTYIFTNYVASGTIGDCGSCHGLTTARAAYTWLKNDGQIDGTKSAMVTKSSDFSWFGGFMPPGGPKSEPKAVSDMKAWVAAGALEN